MAIQKILHRTVWSGFLEIKELSVSFMHSVVVHRCRQNTLIPSYPVCRQLNCCISTLAMRKATRRIGRASIDLGQTLGQTNIQRNSWTDKHSDRQIFKETIGQRNIIFGHTNIQRNCRTGKHSEKYSEYIYIYINNIEIYAYVIYIVG